MYKVLLRNLSSDFETLKKIQKENSYGRKARKMDKTGRRDPKGDGQGACWVKLRIQALEEMTFELSTLIEREWSE